MRGEFVRYLDPLTEAPVVRLTALSSAAVLSAPFNHAVSSLRTRYLVFSSDRSGTLAPFRVDLRTAIVQQIAEAKRLDPHSVTLDATERHLYFIDDGQLRSTPLVGRNARTLLEGVSAFSLTRSGEPVVISNGKLQVGSAGVIAMDAIGPCIVSPDGSLCLFCRNTGGGREFWYAPLGGGKPRLLASGPISFPFWADDGSGIVFLRQSADSGAIEVRGAATNGNERLISRTSRFAAFAPNRDGSVYVGASASKAQPLILLLLRSNGRELPLCTYDGGDAEATTPVFSPDNRRVYFQSTREGKSAIYSVNTELLVESA